MKKYILLPILILFSMLLFAQSTDSLTLKDFKIEDVYIPSREATVYELNLLESEEEISVLLYTKPEEIVASYFDDHYLILVYRRGNNCYLRGAYKENGKWEKDYFHTQLGLTTGLTSKVLKTARFLDGETLLISYESTSFREREKRMTRSILRICQNEVYIYEQSGVSDKGNNPIRPID